MNFCEKFIPTNLCLFLLVLVKRDKRGVGINKSCPLSVDCWPFPGRQQSTDRFMTGNVKTDRATDYGDCQLFGNSLFFKHTIVVNQQRALNIFFVVLGSIETFFFFFLGYTHWQNQVDQLEDDK